MGRILSALEWAFLVYHVMEDRAEDVMVQRILRKEDWTMRFLIQHQPDGARSILLEEKDIVQEQAETDPQEFLVMDPWFSDRRTLDEILAGQMGNHHD